MRAERCVLVEGSQSLPLLRALVRCGTDLSVAKESEHGPLDRHGLGLLAERLGIVEGLLVALLGIGRVHVARLRFMFSLLLPLYYVLICLLFLLCTPLHNSSCLSSARAARCV